MNEQISSKDLTELFFKVRKILGKVAFATGIFVFICLAVQAPKYKAVGLFKQETQKNTSSMLLQNLVKELVFVDHESSAIPLMQSRRLVRHVIEEMGLQIERPRFDFWHSIWKNIKAECGIYLSDDPSFVFKDVHYEGMRKQTIFLRFFDAETFEVLDHAKQVVAHGKRNQAVDLPELTFILTETPLDVRDQKLYRFKVKPWLKRAEQLARKISIVPHRKDAKTLILEFQHSDRHVAAAFVNHLMAAYKICLEEDNEQVAAAQLAYLEKRQTELVRSLDLLLDEHTLYLRQNLGEEGFISLAQQVEILSAPKQEYTSRLFDIDLKLQRERERIPLQTDLARFETRLLDLDLAEKKQPPEVFQEIQTEDLGVTEGLLLDYRRQLDGIQAEQQQLLFIRDQIQKPEFELSCLSEVLKDSVSQSMVARASEIALSLHDETNRTQKDLDRLRESLATQKTFICHHVKQTLALNQIKAKLTQEKIAQLQNTAVGLLKNEKKLVEEKLSDIRRRYKNLPEKWRLENQFKLQTELTKSVMQGITQLVESKYVDLHMHQIASKPLDQAYPPLEPRAPNLLLYALVSACLSAFCTYLFYLRKEYSHTL